MRILNKPTVFRKFVNWSTFARNFIYTDQHLSGWCKLKAESQGGGAEADSTDVKAYKSLARIVAEQKDIMKLSYQLSSVIASLRPEVNEVISGFSSNYDELWTAVSSAFFCLIITSL